MAKVYYSGVKEYMAFTAWLFNRTIDSVIVLDNDNYDCTGSEEAFLVVGLGRIKTDRCNWKSFTGTVIAINGEHALIKNYNDIDAPYAARKIVVLGYGGSDTPSTRAVHKPQQRGDTAVVVPVPMGILQFINMYVMNDWSHQNQKSQKLRL